MPVTINGTTGIAGVDGSASTPSVQGSDTNTGVFYPAADTVGVSTGGSERMRVDSSGNVGIGTSSPATKFQVAGSSGSLNARINANNTGLDITNNDATGVVNLATSPLGAGGKVMSFTMFNGTSSAEAMRIDSSGRLLIGATATSAYFDGPLCAYNASSLVASFKTDSATAYPLACYSTATSGNNLFITFLTEGTPTTRGYIDYNRAGTAVRYNTSSDERLKKNIVDAGSAIPLINSIKIRSFDWKETDSHVDFGVIAQELNTVAPDAVSEGTTGDDMTKTWGVDTSTLVPALIKAIQELSAKVDAQAAEIAALKANAPA